MPFFPFILGQQGYETISMLHAGSIEEIRFVRIGTNCGTLLPESAQTWSTLILWLALGNVIFVGLVTIAQNNLKSMVGNESVMHMGYCFLGIGACSSLGASSAIMLMVAHGLSVSLMFFAFPIYLSQDGNLRNGEMGGLAKQTPLLASFFVAASLATIGLPGFGNFWGEFGVFLSLGEKPGNMPFLILAAFGIIISAIFGLRAVARMFFGSATEELVEVESKSQSKT